MVLVMKALLGGKDLRSQIVHDKSGCDVMVPKVRSLVV